jgi:hypothetical protein
MDGRLRKHLTFHLENLRRDNFENLDLDDRILLKRILKKEQSVRV